MKTISLIESHYPSLTKTEKIVADYFLDKKLDVIYQTLTEISNTIDVGESTILRFCQKVGFSGFQEIKLAIAREYTPEETSNEKGFIHQVTESMCNAIQNTKVLIDENNLQKIIDVISKAKKLFFFGVGASGFAAKEAQLRFLRIGRESLAVVDSHIQLMTAATCQKGDVVVAISLSGHTIDILESVNIAKRAGATIVAITNYILSPLAEISDHVLLTAGKENVLYGGTLIAKISQLYVIDLLCTGYSIKNAASAKSIQEKTAEAVIIRTRN